MQLRPYEVIALMKIELEMAAPDTNRLAAFVEALKKSRARETQDNNREAA